MQFAYPPGGNAEPADGPVPSENHRRFVDTMYRYLSQACPEDLADLGEEKLREIVELGIDIAAGYGIEVERDVGYYIDIMFQYGFVFQDEPEMKWAKKNPAPQDAHWHREDGADPPSFRVGLTLGTGAGRGKKRTTNSGNPARMDGLAFSRRTADGSGLLLPPATD